MACKGFDEQVARDDPRLNDVLERFVRVRVVQANSLDLALFQFDYDLTFAVFFMNADRTIYGRYGSRSSQKEAARDISIEGLRKAALGALELHGNYPASRQGLAGKMGPRPQFKVPEDYPSLRSYKPTLDYGGAVAKSCMHCHMVGAAARKVTREARLPLTSEQLYPWPMPDAVGLTLDPREKATVSEVRQESPAARDGFRAGDEIVTLDGQPLLSIADVQWILHRAGERRSLDALVRRGPVEARMTMSLPPGWRRGDISWRTTTWDLRRMGSGGLLLEDLDDEARREAGLEAGTLALRVKHVGQYGEHAAAKKAGFRKDDLIVEIDGRDRRLTESEMLAHLLETTKPGDRVPVTVLRGGERLALKLPMQ